MLDISKKFNQISKIISDSHPLESRIRGDDIWLSLISFIMDIGLNAHLCISGVQIHCTAAVSTKYKLYHFVFYVNEQLITDHVGTFTLQCSHYHLSRKCGDYITIYIFKCFFLYLRNVLKFEVISCSCSCTINAGNLLRPV